MAEPLPTRDQSRRSEQGFWDQRFADDGYAYGQAPDRFLVSRVCQLTPGRALCLAEGGGRNAVYLAKQGFQVTAQDFSPQGLRLAQDLAKRRGVELTCVQMDLAEFVPPAASVDLVVAIWMHLPPTLRNTVHRRASIALKPGGDLILVAFTPRQLLHQTGGPSMASWLVEPAQLRQDFADLDCLVLEEVTTLLEDGPAHQGRSAVVRLHARKQR
ncbi:MAG: class I SAM-dependent methyltransferase [Synechococcus sp.]